MRDSIWDIMQQLGLSISTPFEVNIFVNKGSDVILSEDLLFDLKVFKFKLLSKSLLKFELSHRNIIQN